MHLHTLFMNYTYYTYTHKHTHTYTRSVIESLFSFCMCPLVIKSVQIIKHHIFIFIYFYIINLTK